MRQVASITSTFNPQLGHSHICILQQERKTFRKFLFQRAKFAPCPALGGGRKGSSSQSPTWKVLQPPGASHPAQQPPLCSTANLTPKNVTSLQGNRSHGKMSTTYCHQMSSRTEVARSHTHLPPPSSMSGVRGVTLPELPAQPRSQALPSQAEQPGCTRTKSHLHISAREGTLPLPPQHRVVTGIPHLSRSSGDTHTQDPRCQPGCCPCSRSNRASRQAPAPPWQQKERREGRRRLGDIMVDTQAEGTQGCSVVAAGCAPAPAQRLPAQGRPRRHQRGPGLANCFKSSHRELLRQCNTNQLHFPQLSGHRHWRRLAGTALSQTSSSTSGKHTISQQACSGTASNTPSQHQHSHIHMCITLKHSSS